MLPSIPLTSHCQNVRKTEYSATRVWSPGEMRDVRKTDDGRGLRGGGGEKVRVGYLLHDLVATGINADQWSIIIAAQGKREWRKTAKQGAKRFMPKWITEEKVGARLRHVVVCPNVPGRTNDGTA